MTIRYLRPGRQSSYASLGKKSIPVTNTRAFTLLWNRVPGLESVTYRIIDGKKNNGFHLEEEVVAVVSGPDSGMEHNATDVSDSDASPDSSLGLEHNATDASDSSSGTEHKAADPSDLYITEMLDRSGVWIEMPDLDSGRGLDSGTEHNATDACDSSSDSSDQASMEMREASDGDDSAIRFNLKKKSPNKAESKFCVYCGDYKGIVLFVIYTHYLFLCPVLSYDTLNLPHMPPRMMTC
eukprot:scaffold36335_cov58-Attheya_sp.AAC.4